MATPNPGVPAAEQPCGATPTQLLLAFLGSFVLDHDGRGNINAQVIIELLGFLDVTEGAARVTLNRMVKSGLLQRTRIGRLSAYALTSKAVAILREGRLRVDAPDPFLSAADEWTLLSYSVPESRRDLRHRLRSQLLWSGFGRIRDGLWVAPGAVDVGPILELLRSDGAIGFAFTGQPVDFGEDHEFISVAWDLVGIRSRHDAFIGRWSDASSTPPNPVAAQTALAADWLALLRVDPGLPCQYLPDDWPAGRSTALYHQLTVRNMAAAEQTLDQMIEASAQQR